MAARSSRALDRHRADVVLMDLRMPKVDGIAAMELVRRQPHPPAVLVLTTFDTDDQVLRALRRGAAGFLVKDTPPAEIVRAIELVAAGESMLSPTVTRRLIDRLAGDGDAVGAPRGGGGAAERALTARPSRSRRRSRRASPTRRSPPSCTSASRRSRVTSRRCWRSFSSTTACRSHCSYRTPTEPELRRARKVRR